LGASPPYDKNVHGPVIQLMCNKGAGGPLCSTDSSWLMTIYDGKYAV